MLPMHGSLYVGSQAAFTAQRVVLLEVGNGVDAGWVHCVVAVLCAGEAGHAGSSEGDR